MDPNPKSPNPKNPSPKHPNPTYHDLCLQIHEGPRLDQQLLSCLRHSIPELSRATLKMWFAENRVQELLPQGAKKLHPSDQLPPGEHRIRILGLDAPNYAAQTLARPSPRGCFLRVLFENEALLILDKTSGTPSIPHAAEETDTAVSAALAHLPQLRSIGKGGLEPAILHRLDTGTSGVLAFAKTEAEYQRLRELWSTHAVRKIYRAIVAPSRPDARLPALPVELRIPLAHDARSAKRMIALPPAQGAERRKPVVAFRGKPLPTVTWLLAAKAFDHCLDLEVQIQTGVMHQIRCTLASLGFPIVGDPLYRGIAAPRLWLHAWRLELPGAEGNALVFEAPLPGEWPGRE